MPAAVVERRILGHGGKNWVTETSAPDAINQLPKFISFVAGALHRNGHSVGDSIAIAVGTCRRWAAGGGHVTPITRSRAAAAIAEWESKKSQTKHGVRLSVNLAGAGWLPGPDAEWKKLVGGKVVSRKPFGQGHHEGVKEASGVAKHHGFTDAQIAEATKAMTARAKERQAADKARHDRGLTGAQAAEEILAKTGHGKATKDTAKADRNALVKHMRAEERKEAAAVGHNGPIRHGGKVPKETTKARPGRSGPGRGKQRSPKGLSPGIEAQRQELLKRIAAMTADINARAQGHEKQAAQAHKEGKLGKAFRSLGRAVGLRRALHAHHNAAAGVLLGSTTKGAKLRAHLERAAVRQHGKANVASGRAFGAAAGAAGSATAVTAVYGGMHAAKLFGMSNGDSVPTIDLAGFKASQKRAPVGGPTGGQWTPVGGAAPATPKGTVGVTPALKSWAQKQIGHYPPNVNTAALRTKWDNWFRFLTLPPATQARLAKANPGKTPKRPVKPPIAQLPFLLSNGGAMEQLELASAVPANGTSDGQSVDLDTVLTKHIRSGHKMRVPKGTAPAGLKKMHSFLHRKGRANHTHGKAMSMSLDQGAFAVQLAEARRAAQELAAQQNAGQVKGVSGTSSEARKAASSKGQALSDGSFPVTSPDLLRRALLSYGRAVEAGKGAQVKALILRNAERLGKPADWGQLMSWAHGGQSMSNPATALGRVLGGTVELARRGRPMAHPYRPTGPERTHVVSNLKAARALRRKGNSRQAASIEGSLIAKATNRARAMPDGSRRAHTTEEARLGIAVLTKMAGVKGTGFDTVIPRQPAPGTANVAKAKGPQPTGTIPAQALHAKAGGPSAPSSPAVQALRARGGSSVPGGRTQVAAALHPHTETRRN